MKSESNFVLVVLLITFSGSHCTAEEHPDTLLSIEELIQRYGYPMERHEVTTADSYILTMFRIPHGRHESVATNNPVLMMHGMAGQAENFIVNGMNNGSLAYLLADNGYDVWLGNTRGTKHGLRHKFLDPQLKDFWNYSYHEISVYDLAAKIDYILNTTKKEKVHYVGHSQGGTIFYVLCSWKPEYQNKIQLSSLLAPGGYEKHFTNPLVLPLVAMHEALNQITETIYRIPPGDIIPVTDSLTTICRNPLFSPICVIVYHLIAGGNSSEVDEQILPLAMRFISSSSSKQLLHFAQGIATGHFRPWDYGTEKNINIYGKPVPDDYAIQNIAVPTAMYYSEGDTFAYARDIEEICDAMKNCVRKFVMSNKKWTHMDFLFAKNLANELNIYVLELILKYDYT